MERLILTARVEREDAKYVALIEGLSAVQAWVRGEGESPDSAREELIQAMLSWISSHDCAESMAAALSAAGFPEIDQNPDGEPTELQLEFPHPVQERVP